MTLHALHHLKQRPDVSEPLFPERRPLDLVGRFGSTCDMRGALAGGLVVESKMMKHLLTAAAACGALALVGTASTASAEPKGHAYGYWAGRLCDHVGPTTGGMTYWESRGYESRDECVAVEGASLRAGEWDPDELDPDVYPI